MQRLILLLLFVFTYATGAAQEFNCNVQVISPQLQSSDKKIFETLQNALRDFVNNRKWTDDAFLNQERIECTITLNIAERPTSDQFKGTIEIQARRPVYKTSYGSTLLNFIDENLLFRYIEDQTLEYNENNNTSALTSIIAYYCYIMLGLDYDSFAMKGGTLYLERAQTIVNMSQTAGEPGWRANENLKNRYWLIENLLAPLFNPLREVYYRYHRKGLDIMTQDVTGARTEIIGCLEQLQKVAIERPNSLLMQVFFNAKADELINIFSQASSQEKTKASALLNEINPSNSIKYQKIGK